MAGATLAMPFGNPSPNSSFMRMMQYVRDRGVNVVLISGDADHEMLARKLKALKTHTILLTWDPANTGSTSRFLKEEVCTHMDMSRMTSHDETLLKRLTSPAK